MMQEASVVLHAGHGQVPFLEYLYRVLVHLLALAAVAGAARWCLGVFEAMNAGSPDQRDGGEADR